MTQWVKNPPAMQETQETFVQSLGQEDPLRRKWQPIPVFLPRKLDRGACRDIVHGVAKSQTRLID